MVVARARVVEIDRGWRALRETMKAASDAHAKVGVLGADAAEIEHDDGNLTNVELAIIHEFGAPDAGIPERSFIRAAIDEHRSDYIELLKKLVRGIYEGKMTAERALGLLGTRAAADVKKYITTGSNLEPLADSTIARKGSSRPLVDTGRLVASITYEVVMRGRSTGQAVTL